MPLKVLYLVSEDWYFASHRLELARAAKTSGFDVVVAARAGRHVGTIEKSGLRFVPLDFERSSLNPLREFKLLFDIVRLYRREAPDLVHHVALKPVIYGSLAARATSAPAIVNAVMGLGYVFSANTSKARALKPLVLRLLKMALRGPQTRTIVQNKNDLVFLEDGIATPGSVRLIPGSGVDMTVYAAKPIPEGPPLIVLPARLIREKGVLLFAEAARRLAGEGHKSRFALIGSPDPSNPSSLTESELRDLSACCNVEYWGYRSDMSAVLTEASVVCLPTFYGEGVPKSLIEAAASGRAIVTTDTPGCRDIVKHGVNGWLIPPRDVDALTIVLREAIMQPDLVRQYGARGPDIVREGFSLDAVIDQTLALYREASDALRRETTSISGCQRGAGDETGSP